MNQKIKNDFFPLLDKGEVISIKKECRKNHYSFIYDRQKRLALLKRQQEVEGNVSFYHGKIVVKIDNRLNSLFEYVKLGSIFNNKFQSARFNIFS